jgi:hypothetical protein
MAMLWQEHSRRLTRLRAEREDGAARAMLHFCAPPIIRCLDQIRVTIVDESAINAGSAGNGCSANRRLMVKPATISCAALLGEIAGEISAIR